MNYPDNLKYSKEHEWVSVEHDVATIGITDFAQDQLGDIVFVDFEVEAGDQVQQNDTFGSVEAVKTVSDLFMPVSGTVTAINEQLEDNPEFINSAPYGDGWIIKVKLSEHSELDTLHSAADYAKMVTE